MKKQIWNTQTACALLVAVALFEVGCSRTTTEVGKPEPTAQKPAAASAACTPPSAITGSNEETAWRLFVAAVCKVPGTEYLTYQTWTEQNCWYDPGSCAKTAAATAAPVRHLHGSRLGEIIRRKGLGATVPSGSPGDCNSTMTQVSGDSPLNPFVPKNITSKAQFCEEVYVNQAEADYVNAPAPGASLTTLAAQFAYAKGTPIKFPTPSIEIKADWLPADSVNNQFDCANNRPAGVYVEMINGKCYALVGMHISSKLLPDWLWATFEPQSTLTNPNRCNPNLYNGCNDPWGSSPATSTGQPTSATAALTDLMNQAGLAKEFLNYRLTGVQTALVTGNNQPIELGNSFVEFNAGVLPHQASCMTCHSYAQMNKDGTESSFLGPPHIGTPRPTPTGNIPQDFSWMLGFMPAGTAGTKQ
jgi:hypothetical protein